MLSSTVGLPLRLALLRSLYREQAKQERMRLIDVWRIGLLTTSLADFAFLRTWTPFGDGDLPAQVAVLYKAALGIALTTSSMWADGAARFDAHLIIDEAHATGCFGTTGAGLVEAPFKDAGHGQAGFPVDAFRMGQ